MLKKRTLKTASPFCSQNKYETSTRVLLPLFRSFLKLPLLYLCTDTHGTIAERKMSGFTLTSTLIRGRKVVSDQGCNYRQQRLCELVTNLSL